MSASIRLGVTVAVALALVCAGLWLPIGDWIDRLEHWITELGLAGLAAFVVIYVIATCLLVPVSTLTLLAGLAYGSWGFPLVMVSATLGAGAAFLIGRYVARDSVQRRVQTSRRLWAVNQAVSAEGWRIVGLLRLSPVFPFGLQNYLFSLSSIGFWPYLLATFVGIMPGTGLYVYLGSIGKAAGDYSSTTQWLLLGAGLVTTLIIVWLVSTRARRALDELDIEPDVLADSH